MKSFYLLIAVLVAQLIFLPFQVVSQNTNLSTNKIVELEAFYIGDNAINLSGGARQGATYMGMANAKITFDFSNTSFRKVGKLHINAANIHATRSLSGLVGDHQVSSNIDAGNHTYLQELWIQQSIGSFEFTAGLQDLNVEFANSGPGSLFLNSSFGILPTISSNMCAPIFPLTTLGLTVKYSFGENFTWLNAIYDGCPIDFNDNPYNLKWKFNRLDGLLTISELQFNTSINQKTGTYKLGIFSSDQWVSKNSDYQIPDSLNRDMHGLYFQADQTLWNNDSRQLDVFTQLGYSPASKSTTDLYYGLGFNLTGLFSQDGNDVIGFAIARESFTYSKDNETVIELTYQHNITENIFIQPDMQYVINPSGTGESLPDALVGSIRFGISF